MFKLESYITPILLSYVDKYIKNFRPEDSQVSLWGGDASFHNLDLRLDVLEEELQLPFNLVSGHIHELLIHVPWTKLASEPINITINTIECVLKLRGSYSPNADSASTSSKERKRKSSQSKKQEIAAPPGYVQSLINKIVNNITINCNNLILKYVEEDIVISVNIKMLTFQSADGEWQPAFTEISPTQMIMRKLITLSDLTICLDKRNAAGKIEVYQEPILYRCSIEIRFLKQFYSSNSDKTLNTRIDVHCNRMEFSMTEQQIPMLLRIINLAIALQQRQLKKHTNVESAPGNFGTTVDEANTSDAYGESWAGWAWSFAANIFPTEDETNLEWNNMNNSESSLQCGVYIDNVIFTFKVSEYYSNDKGYYATRKVKYWPLLCLQLNGCYVDTVILGVEWTSFQMGIAEALLLPQGCCSCGLTDVSDDIETKYYLKTGTYNGNHLMNSLFDPNINPKSPRRCFTKSWDFYLNSISEAVLLEKTSAFAIDFLYHLEVPEDFSSEKLSEFENDLEYSNLVEKSICRIVAGPSVTNVCSGLIHRISTLYEVMKSYDYPPYVEPPIEPKLSELHPPTEDDFDSLSNLIPKRIYQVTFLKPVFQIQLMDHPKFVPSKRDLFRKLKKSSGCFAPSTTCPCVTLECETVDVKIVIPMYPKRLIYTTCQLPEPPDEMFACCYFHADVNITGFSSQMIFTSNKKTTILLPFNVCCNYKSIIFPNYWINPEINHKEMIMEIDSITLTATKAKLMVISKIIEKLIAMDIDEYKCSIYASSLLQDAPIDAGMVVLELYGEQLKWRTIKTISTESHKISLDSLRAFALEPSEFHQDDHEIKINNEPNQVLIVSGPEISESKTNITNSLLTISLQFPRNAERCVHPPIIFFNLEEMKICIDPLFFQWLFYCPKLVDVKQDGFWPSSEHLSTYKPRALSDMSGASLQETPRRANTPHESIHSSSEREPNIVSSSPRPQTTSKQTVTINSDNIYYDFLMKWYLVWTNIIVYGDIKACTIYLPKQSLPAIGSQGIEDAINMSLKLDIPIEIVVVKLPSASIRTAGQKQSLMRYTTHLPITLPNTIWTSDKQSFPWTIEIKQLCCYTLQNRRKLFFLKPISGNITMSLSIKYRNVMLESKKHVSFETKPIDNISSFSIYVHIDNTPIEIALSEMQVCLISSILLALYEVFIKLCPTSSLNEKCRTKEDATGSSVLRKSHSRSQSPTVIKDDFHDTISEKTPTSIQTETNNTLEDDCSEIKFIVWLQWTITRLRLKLFGYSVNDSLIVNDTPTLKLVFELEDIMTSLDLQQIYSKFKLKIVTAGILHYKRFSLNDDWKPGDYLGTVMRSREELPSTEKQDDFGFMSVTITKAKCGHVHSKWGTSKKHRLAEMKMEQQSSKENTETRYISEVVATIQPIDFIVSAKVLKSFYMVLEPIIKLSTTDTNDNSNGGINAQTQTKSDHISLLNNSNLPLAYLDCHGVRVVVVSSTGDDGDLTSTGNHDICIIELENMNLVPTAENPICRNPIRADVYQRAAQSRILNVPGSNIEDRQYQLNLKSVSVNTGAWSEFKQVLMRDTSVISSLHTMNENPALEWNNLEWGQSSLTPNLSLLPIIQKFDECIVIAPAIICPTNGLVCGCSIELNCVSDIEMFISLQQFRLTSILTAEFMNMVTPNRCAMQQEQTKFTYFNQKYQFNHEYKKSEHVLLEYSAARDSGNDTMDLNSEITLKTKESFSVSDRRNILKLTGESKNSDITHVKYSSPSNINYCPIEILITGGNISLSLYKITNQKFIEKKNIYSPEKSNKDDAGYDGSEEESIDVPASAQKVQPLLYILISQLNFYLCDNTFEKKINFSAFDVYIKTNESKHTYIMGLPTPKDYQVYILETKSGIPNADTGIPPAFITFKWLKSIGKPLGLNVDFGRPIRIFYSLDKLNHLLYLKEHILENIVDIIPLNVAQKSTPNDHKHEKHEHLSEDAVIDSFIKYRKIKDTFKGIQNFCFKIAQIVFVCKTTCGHEMTFSLESCSSFLGFTVRPEKITNTLIFKGITITTNIEDSTHFLLNPWSLQLKSNFFWESWQSYNSDPQTQISIDNDCFNIDIGPEQLKCVKALMKEINDLQEMFDFTKNETEESVKQLNHIEREQYYKDDLRAGAFQFVDATPTTDPNELPLPYQVMFWNGRFGAMAWRYPQPRILAKVRVFPVPFKLTNEQSKNQQVLCFLEYWSDCHATYKTIAEFHLSESEMFYLELPTNVPQIAVSCTWRVVLTFSDSQLQSSAQNFVSARALAACMRVDSYFNSILIPRLQFAVTCFNVNVSFYNQFNKKLALVMPKKLRNYTPDGLIPDNHCFLILNASYTNIYGACWGSNVASLDIKTNIKCSILDYASLQNQSILEPVNLMFNLTLAETTNINGISGNINLTFSPAIAHTLAVSSQLWAQNWLKNSNENEEPPDMIIITRYVVCNDTNVKIRFGQSNTDENILLPSRFLHLYCWRTQQANRSIRIGIEQNNWHWSKPMNIDKDHVEYIDVSPEKNSCLIVTVKTLSATQKQIVFAGQLVICNMLLDQFEMKIIPFNEPNKDLALKNADRHIVQGKTTAPTILINTDMKLALRLRFLSLESAWSGDIPLEENTKGSQPWLVKIPLQERGQFLSIWCRIIDRKQESRQILVMLWPLFMLRSNLPVKTHVFVETSALNVRLETNLKGRGELQQLYCPGTIDHSHNLIFDISSSTSPHIPINYSLIDHKEIFKKIEKDNIFDILEYLMAFDEPKWPYIDNNLDTLDLSCDIQPIAHVQTIYRNVCKYSSCLLVELIPWCLLINTLGVPISIIHKEHETLTVKHYGVVTPPKLENTFNIGIEIDEMYVSPLLQLAKADWSQSFYMPKINGIIPLEGNIKIPVKCDLQMCMMSITSSVVNNLRILQISSKYIIINHTKLQLEVTCIALPPNNDKIYDMFEFSQSNSILLEPHLDKKNIGVPLTTWNCVEDISDTVSDYTFHLIISLENKFAQSSPIQLDNGLSRTCICLYSHTENIPLVLIAQEHKGQIYLSIHPDIHPQLLIKNKCSQQIFCAQHDASITDTPCPVMENNYIHWICNIFSDTESYYTMPSVSENFPNVDSNTPEKLILAVKCEDVIPSYQWSQEININIFNEQYVRIPQYGDIKLSIKKSSATIIVTIDSVTEVEISAQDIRSRLLMQSTNILHDNKFNLIKSTSQYEIREKNHPLQNIKSTSDLAETSNSSRFLTDFTNIDKQCKVMKNCCGSSKECWDHFNLAVVLKSVVLSLVIDNQENSFKKINLSNIICDYVGITLEKNKVIDLSLSVANIQCDNQLFNTGSYDFPVILKGENSNILHHIDEHNRQLLNFINEIKTEADLVIDLRLEVWEDKNIQKSITEIQEIKVKFGPLSLYIEDSYITLLIEYLCILNPPQLVVWSIEKKPKISNIHGGMVKVPEYLSWESKLLAKPLFLQNLSVEPMTLLLSLHSSVKLYIALDRSPLQFNKFERKNVTTTPYRLGQALTMHFLSDAIFGAGWVVGSLELLGSPSGLARTVGSGLRDFISLPYNGLIQGPWAFLVGITHGSASLMRHITAGTLDSVTKLASSVARNLDRLTLDAEHQKRTEELRRQRPQGLAQGFLQGLTGLGISLLGAVGGIAHHSLQSVMNDGATPRGLVAGVGLGLVGVFTKPLSGAAELVALTGQGLLQGAGWNPLPEPRSIKTQINRNENCILKYTWKVLQNAAAHKIVSIVQVDYELTPVLLIVSFDALILIDVTNDGIKRVVSVNEISDIFTDGLMEIQVNLVQPPQNPETAEIEMDPVSRARVADYVKNSAGLVQLSPLCSNTSDDDGVSLRRPVITVPQPCLVFRVNSPIRNYLCDILELVRQQNRNNTFKIL